MLFHAEKSRASSSHAFFSFPGSWSLDGCYSGDKAFGEKEINLQLFPSMKSIGNYDEAKEPRAREFAIAFVNQAFLHKFEHILQSSQVENQLCFFFLCYKPQLSILTPIIHTAITFH